MTEHAPEVVGRCEFKVGRDNRDREGGGGGGGGFKARRMEHRGFAAH